MRAVVTVGGVVLALAIVAAVVWFGVALIQVRLSRESRSGPGLFEWFRGRVDARRERAEAENLARVRADAPWISYRRPDGEEWVIGVHRKPLGNYDGFDEREMYRLPWGGDLFTRLEAEGEAIGRANDFNHRREGMG